MFCYQCEQTFRGSGCTEFSVCGKDEGSAALQDLLVYACKGIAQYARRAAQLGVMDKAPGRFIGKALFSTVTNVNFDQDRLAVLLKESCHLRDDLKARCAKAAAESGKTLPALSGPAEWSLSPDLKGLIRDGSLVSVHERLQSEGPDIAGLQELVVYGLKGTAAYAHHAAVLGKEDDSVYDFFTEALDYLAQKGNTVPELLGYALRCGEINLKVMGLLDAANTGTYGHPEPTSVRISAVKGNAILVSGHELSDLEALLKQTEGKGINVYTHGEMLPAHGYPKLKAYPHLAGNYGGAWQDQADEFDRFPGPILMTTNCIQAPRPTYIKRIFSSGLVAWPGVRHVSNHDFSPLIDAALKSPGFPATEPEKRILTGFGHHAVLGVADKVINAVKAGDIRHFFLVGGCDGARPGRDYYTRFVEMTPRDTIVLTLACGKYRFNKNDWGDIKGIPRLLDVGQCNDAFSAIQIAVALAKAFNCGVNDLPLSLVLSWYEQKAVAILLTLLFLGIKNIRIGPTLPAFLTPTVRTVLAEKFNLMPISTPETDLQAILG